MAFSVYAQADVVSARLELAPAGDAGALETTIMEAIDAGANTLPDLTGILGLAPRLVLQVVGDLWRADRVVVELGSTNEVLRLSSRGAQELERLAGDASLETTAKTITAQEVAFERLTGRVLPVNRTRRRIPAEDRQLVIPPQPDDRSLATIDSADLIDALVKTFEAEGDGTIDRLGDQRVVSAFVEPGQLQVATKRNYYRLRAGAEVSAAGELRVAVLDEKLPLVDRVRATERLQAIVDAEPRSRLALAIRARASQDLMESRGVLDALSELTDLVHSMDTCRVEDRQQTHDRAEAVAEQVVAYAQHLAAREMDVRLLRTSEEHLAAVNQLITEARQQVVLAVPWVRSAGVLAVRDSLYAAIDAGVQVVLLWGIDGHLDGLGEAGGLFASLAAHAYNRGGPGQLLYSPQRAARSHAKLVISDDRRMLVTSKNFLSDSHLGELGVVLGAVGSHSSPVIEAALRYVNVKAPDPRIARELHRQPGAFGPRVEVPRPHVELPRLAAPLLEPNAPASAVNAWRAAWVSAIDQLRRTLDRPLPTVRLLTDLQHRGLVRDTLEAADRVALTSDRVSEDALTDDVAGQVAAAAERGADVLVCYRRSEQPPISGLARINDLAAASASVTVTHDDLNHAKILLADDRVVIGSFNPLSVDAALRHDRSTGELGVAINSSNVSDQVWQMLGGGRPRERHSLEPVEGESAAHVSAEQARLGQQVAEALLSDRPDELVRAIGDQGLQRVLDAHRMIGGDAGDLSRLGGAALASPGGQEPTALTFVQAEAMTRCNWGLAGLVTRLLGEESPVRQAFVEALDEGRADVGAYLTAVLGDQVMSEAEADALMVVDLVSLLLDPQAHDAADTDELMGAVTPTRARDFVGATIAYLRRFGRLPGSPPPTSERVEVTDLAQAWRRAADEFDSFARYDSKSAKGDAFLLALFDPGGEFFDLGEALAAKNGEAVQAWYQERTRIKDDKKWLDRAVHAAGIERIVDNRRKPFLEHRRRLRLAVAALCAQLEGAATADTEVWTGDQLSAVTDVLAQADALHEGLRDSTTVEDRVLIAALDRLDAWRTGAKHHWEQDLDGWSFVAVHLARLDDPDPSDAALAAAGGLDLATRRSPHGTVLDLVDLNQFERASWVIERLEALSLLSPAEVKSLRRLASMSRRAAVQVLEDRLELLRRRCEWAGVPEPGGTLMSESDRVVEREALLTQWEASVDYAIARRREELTPSPERREQMDAAWGAYVDELLAGGDLVLAENALRTDHGRPETPHARLFARWSWRGARLDEIVGWFAGDVDAPGGMRGRFGPNADDVAGKRLIGALAGLVDGGPGARARWVHALQLMVAPVHQEPPRLRGDGDAQLADFYLPHHDLLPRLRWVGGEPITVAVGEVPVPGTSVRFATDAGPATTNEPVIDIADVLSMLRLAEGNETPSQDERVLRFLTLIAGSVPLDRVIAPEEMPVATSPDARRRLAWLLTMLGVAGEPVDRERLSLTAGGHPGVMWTLVDRARGNPVGGIASLLADPGLDSALVDGVDTDLGRDDDVLVLAIGLAYGALEDGCSEEDLAALVADEWMRHQRDAVGPQGRPHLQRFRVADVVARLVDSHYLVRRNGLLFSCRCRASIALGRVADEDWLDERMRLLDPEALMEAKAYEVIVDMVYHEQQAEAVQLTEVQVADEADRRVLGRLSDLSPFDLTRLCRRVADRFNRRSLHLYVELDRDELVVAGAGPEIWVETFVKELLNNAVKATADLPEEQPAIMYLRLGRDPRDATRAVVEVRNNGRLIPDSVLEALSARRRWRHPQDPERGAGLYALTTFGERFGVNLEFSIETDATDVAFTVARLGIPLSGGEA